MTRLARATRVPPENCGLAIDPGGGRNRELKQDVAHCGWAEFQDEAGNGKWKCTSATEYTAEDCVDRFVAGLLSNRPWRWVAIEEWRLYPEQADRHVGSDFPTAQLIGALKHAFRWGNRKHGGGLRLYMLPASVKDPTLALLSKRGVTLQAVANKAGGHAKDAEVLGWARLLRPEPRRTRVKEPTRG